MNIVASFNQVAGLFKVAGEMGIIKFSLIAVVIIGAYFGVKYVSQYKFNKTAEKTGIKVGNETDLRYHVLFTRGEYMLNVELMSLDVFPDKPVRRQLVIDLLKAYITTLTEGCKEIALVDMKAWSSEQWVIEMTKNFNAMLQGAANRARNDGMPEIAISRFSMWANNSLETLFQLITTIGATTAYSNNVVKTNTLFLIVNLMIATMLGEAERSIHSLNGDITGTIYKGNVVEDAGH